MIDKNINPSLKDLEPLVGDWEMEISNATFLPSLKDKVNGSAKIEWTEGGDFLTLRQGTKDGVAPWATWLIGHDQDSENYTVLYIDDRRFSRVYEMSFKNDVWKIWRNAPGFVQSFEGELSRDRNTIKGSWGKSVDGKKWEHDFDLVYKRVKKIKEGI